MALPLAKFNKSTGWYEGDNHCLVCNNIYTWSEGINADIIVYDAGRIEEFIIYPKCEVYSKCPKCDLKNKHFCEIEYTGK